MSWISSAIGLFYVLAGVVVLKQMALDKLMDVVLDALGQKPDSKEKIRTRLLILGGCLTFASGLALMTLSRWATVIFAANVLVQGGYLIWANRALPPETDEDRLGRRRTTNALILYLAAFAFVAHAHAQGVLAPWPIDLGAVSGFLEPLVIGCATACLWGYWFVHMPRTAKPAWSSRPEDELNQDDYPSPTLPNRLRLAPEYGCWPTWDDETGDSVDPSTLDLSSELLKRLDEWDQTWQATFDPDDPLNSGFTDASAAGRWEAEGQAIADQLAVDWPGSLFVKPVAVLAASRATPD